MCRIPYVIFLFSKDVQKTKKKSIDLLFYYLNLLMVEVYNCVHIWTIDATHKQNR